MSEAELADNLNRLLATESRGLLRFLEQLTPYLTSRTFKIWSDVQQIAKNTADHARRLTEILDRLELPVRTPSFDTAVANYHYARLETLLPILIAETRRQVDAYGRAIELASEEASVRSDLQRMLDENRGHLEKLERHADSLPEQTPPVTVV